MPHFELDSSMQLNSGDDFCVALNHWLDSAGEFGTEDLVRFRWVNHKLAKEEIEFMLREGLIEPLGTRYRKRTTKSFKLIFLDIDGVLNSSCGGNFKESCITSLKRIVDATDPKLILVSDWESGWEKEKKELQDDYGNYLDQILGDHGLEIYDKRSRNSGGRTVDVLDWVLRTNAESFVVLDDSVSFYIHPLILKHCVFTSFSRGLTVEDAEAAIEILNGGI